jgi:hypothetical protein
MDVENILAKASDHLSVRRAFGAAYEKDGMLIIPVALVAGGGGGGAARPRHQHEPSAARSDEPAAPDAVRRNPSAWTPAGLRRTGYADGRLRRPGRPGPLGSRSRHDHPRPGHPERGKGAQRSVEPPPQKPRPTMTPVSGPVPGSRAWPRDTSARCLPGEQGLGTGVGRHHEALVGRQAQVAELAQRQQGV